MPEMVGSELVITETVTNLHCSNAKCGKLLAENREA